MDVWLLYCPITKLQEVGEEIVCIRICKEIVFQFITLVELWYFVTFEENKVIVCSYTYVQLFTCNIFVSIFNYNEWKAAIPEVMSSFQFEFYIKFDTSIGDLHMVTSYTLHSNAEWSP